MEGKLLIEFRVPLPAAGLKRLVVKFFKGPVPIFFSSIALIVFSVIVVYNYAHSLVWIARHDERRLSNQTGFELQFNTRTVEIHKVAWLPRYFRSGPHYQLAIAAAVVCIVSSVAVAALYVAARRLKEPLKAHTSSLVLTSIFLPTTLLSVTATLWVFISWMTASRIDAERLYQQTDPTNYRVYKGTGAYLDLEGWTCGIRPWVNMWYRRSPYGMINSGTEVLEACYRAQRGRWMLLPVVGLLVLTTVTGFIAVRAAGRRDGYVRLEGEEREADGVTLGSVDVGDQGQDPVDEGRVRLE